MPSRRALAFGHQPVHAAAAVAREAVPAVHGAAVVPDDQVADLPFLGPGELVARGVFPELVEQRLALIQRQWRDVGAEAAAEEQRRPRAATPGPNRNSPPRGRSVALRWIATTAARSRDDGTLTCALGASA
jgi:hypothetical protein